MSVKLYVLVALFVFQAAVWRSSSFPLYVEGLQTISQREGATLRPKAGGNQADLVAFSS